MAIRRASKSSISTTSSGKRFNLIAGYSPAVDEMDLIERVVVGATPVSAIVLGSGNTLPQMYTHLQIRYLADTDLSGNIQTIQMQMNGDTGANYRGHEVAGNGTNATASNFSFAASGLTGGTQYIANQFSVGVVDVLDYTNTTKNKVIRSVSGLDSNGSGYASLQSGLWVNTASITSIRLVPQIGNFIQYTTISIYGVVV